MRVLLLGVGSPTFVCLGWLCLYVCASVCVDTEGGSEGARTERGRAQENGFFAGALVVPASLPWLQTKSAYCMSFCPLPMYTPSHSLTHPYAILCICQQWLRKSCTGEKRGISGKGRKRWREMRIENRFMKWSIPNRTICLLWETAFINHHTVAENRAFGRALVCIFVCAGGVS